jgi:hypothetical protein
MKQRSPDIFAGTAGRKVQRDRFAASTPESDRLIIPSRRTERNNYTYFCWLESLKPASKT